MSEIEKTLARRLRLRLRSVSLREASRRSGVSPSQLCRFVRSQRGLTLATASRLARWLTQEA